MQSTGYSSVFAAGDCCTVVGCAYVEKAGVYAVREGPVVAENIAALITGQPLRHYDPQFFFLALYMTGDGEAICSYMGASFTAEWVWRWKDSIDREFMARFDVPWLGESKSVLALEEAR